LSNRKKLEVGDIVLLRENEQIPADIVVLATSDPDDVCFVETKNLDGETNLKVRKALRPTAAILSEEDLARSRFKVEAEAPHANLYTHNGSLKFFAPSESSFNVNDGLPSEKVVPITINELLLRGCTLRNTAWVIGLVSFTGADTKIMLNGGATPSKRSKIEREMSTFKEDQGSICVCGSLADLLIVGFRLQCHC
jgi:phospholipid-translocating ATPase